MSHQTHVAETDVQMNATGGTFVDRGTFTVGVLAITAAILFVGLLMTLKKPSAAHAIGMNAAGGDYIMLTQQLTDSTEGVVIIDTAAEKLVLFNYDFSRRRILPVDGFDLTTLRPMAPQRP